MRRYFTAAFIAVFLCFQPAIASCHSHHLTRVMNPSFLSRFTRLGAFRLTAYTGGDPAQGTGIHTALGEVARYGLVAVPSWIPLGTWLYIPGYGIAKASDHGAAVNGMHIDLCFGIGRPGSSVYRRAIAWSSAHSGPGMVYRIPPRLVAQFK